MTDKELLRLYHSIDEKSKNVIDKLIKHYYYDWTIAGRMEELNNGKKADEGRTRKVQSRL